MKTIFLGISIGACSRQESNGSQTSRQCPRDPRCDLGKANLVVQEVTDRKLASNVSREATGDAARFPMQGTSFKAVKSRRMTVPRPLSSYPIGAIAGAHDQEGGRHVFHPPMVHWLSQSGEDGGGARVETGTLLGLLQAAVARGLRFAPPSPSTGADGARPADASPSCLSYLRTSTTGI
jgi:hypothetical protein